jgi:glucose-6-phosphate 1-dehydrogenase
MSDEVFRKALYKGVEQFSPRGKAEKSNWLAEASFLHYPKADFTNHTSYSTLKNKLSRFEKKWNEPVHRIF